MGSRTSFIVLISSEKMQVVLFIIVIIENMEKWLLIDIVGKEEMCFG